MSLLFQHEWIQNLAQLIKRGVEVNINHNTIDQINVTHPEWYPSVVWDGPFKLKIVAAFPLLPHEQPPIVATVKEHISNISL
jgi:hypothetical protein